MPGMPTIPGVTTTPTVYSPPSDDGPVYIPSVVTELTLAQVIAAGESAISAADSVMTAYRSAAGGTVTDAVYTAVYDQKVLLYDAIYPCEGSPIQSDIQAKSLDLGNAIIPLGYTTGILTGLNAIKEAANGLIQANYTTGSWSDLQTVLSAATVVSNQTDGDRQTMIDDINAAMAALVPATATAPSAIELSAGVTNPVGGVTNVAIPAAGATDTTGAVTGWLTATADHIKFTVTDAGAATSTILINGAAYTSGNDYTIASAASLAIVVTTSEIGRVTGVRTFTVTVGANDISGSFTDPLFKQAVQTWLGISPTPGTFTKQDLINRMAAMSYTLSVTNNPSIVSLAGLENFEGTGLTRLNCYWDPLLTSLPALPSSLTKIYCDYSGFTSLPVLPSGLTELYANNNHLISLPTLPTGLTGSSNGNYLNVWVDPLLTNLASCSGVAKTPQYRYAYTGTAVTLTSAGTRQLTMDELAQQQSSDGSSWSTSANPYKDTSLSVFSFSTSDIAVATVSSGGVITGVGVGTCNIVAIYRNIDTVYTRVTIPVTVADNLVTYNGNGYDGGTVPADASYVSGGSTTAAAVGSMTKAGCTFLGWNTAADWMGMDYAAGATINAAGTTTLYAKWRLDTAPTVANLGFRYFDAYLEVTGTDLPAYTTLEIFIKATDPGETVADTGEAKYTLDLSYPANLTLGWHNVGSSPGINTSYNMWYRYVYGTAKSAWVSDGYPLGMMPAKGGSNAYDFGGVDATNITLNNTGGTYNGGQLYVFRGGSYISLGSISSVNQPFTVQANDCIVVRDACGNYSYKSAAYVYP